MSFNAKTRVLDLLETHPDLDEVFETFDVEVTEDIMAMTLKEVCKAEGLDWWEFKHDLVAAIGWDGSAEYDEDGEDDDDEWDDDEEAKDDDDDDDDDDVGDFDDDTVGGEDDEGEDGDDDDEFEDEDDDDD